MMKKMIFIILIVITSAIVFFLIKSTPPICVFTIGMFIGQIALGLYYKYGKNK